MICVSFREKFVTVLEARERWRAVTPRATILTQLYRRYALLSRRARRVRVSRSDCSITGQWLGCNCRSMSCVCVCVRALKTRTSAAELAARATSCALSAEAATTTTTTASRHDCHDCSHSRAVPYTVASSTHARVRAYGIRSDCRCRCRAPPFSLLGCESRF